MNADQEKEIAKGGPWYEALLTKGVECYIDDDNEESALDDKMVSTIVGYDASEEEGYPFLASSGARWKFAVPVDEDLRVVKWAPK